MLKYLPFCDLAMIPIIFVWLNCGPDNIPDAMNYPPPILNPLPALKCRIKIQDDGTLYDRKLETPCEVVKFNHKTVCLPRGMWEEVGAAWATPNCDKLYDWSKNNNLPCLNGQTNFTLATYPHAGLPQACGDYFGIIYKIKPTLITEQYDKANGCMPWPFQLDLTVSRYSEYVPYPPMFLTEKDFIDPATEQGCDPH